MRIFYLLVVAIIILTNISTYACDYCLLSQGISPLETANGIGFRLDQRYTRLSTLFDHGNEIDNEGAKETHWTTQLTGFYSVTSKITITGIIPFVQRSEEEGEAGGHHDELNSPGGYHSPRYFSKVGTQSSAHGVTTGEGGAAGSSSGLGDIALLGRHQFYSRHSLASTFIAAFQTGIKFPTGSTNEKNGEGEVLNAHIQPGTGAFNFMLGFSLSYAIKRFSFVANGLYSIPTEGKVGDEDYRFGNALNYDASARFRLVGGLGERTNVFVAAGFAGEYRNNEKLNGITLDDTGGHTLYFIPNFQIFLKPLIFEITYWQAIAHDLNGFQLGETNKAYAGITYMIR